MRISDIQRCEVRPGRLVEWTFSPATIAAAAVLPPDPRPPAYIQESHVRTARSVRDDGLFVPTWLGTAFDLPGRADLDALEQALRDWTLRHETLRSGFRWVGDDMHRFTLAEKDVALQREEVGDFADTDALIRYMQDRFDVAADALDWPNLIYAAVLRDESTSVYMAFDHTNVDAYSLQRIPEEIHDLYMAGVTGRPVGPGPWGVTSTSATRSGRTRTGSTTRTPSWRAGGSSSAGATGGFLSSPSTSVCNPVAYCPPRS
ncbi:SL659 acyltransferase papA1 [Streptomyces glaucescens]